MIQVIKSDITEEFLEGISEKVRNKYDSYFNVLEEKGYTLRAKWLGNYSGESNLYDLKVRYNRLFYRIFFCYAGKFAITLNGFYKTTDDTPKEEIERAKKERDRLLGELGK